MNADDCIVEAASAADLERDGTWWDIYEAAFPRDEREPKEVILRSLEDGLGLAVRMRHAADTVGLATLQYLPDLRCEFLVYLAVDGRLRGAGLGTRLFSETLRLAGARQGGAEPDLVWEVDDPAVAKDAAERAKRERRLRFFGHQGGALLPCAYKQPAVDRVAPVPMLLMWRSRAGTPRGFRGSMRDLVRSLYHGKYGHVNGIPAAELDALLAGLPL